MDDLTREFLIESLEGLDRMERCLTELEERPEEDALVAEIFRAVHTIKGTTGFLGFSRLERLAHAGENLLGLLRDGKLTADTAMTTDLLALLDGLRAILHSIETAGSEGEGDDSTLIARLEALQASGEASAGGPAQNPAAKEHVPEADPPRMDEEARTGALPPQEPCSPKAHSESPPEAPPENSSEPPPHSESQPRFEASKPSPETGARPQPAAAAAGPSEEPSPSSAPSSASTYASIPAGSNTSESTLRVDVVLLNRMMNLVGELVLTRNRIQQATGADSGLAVLSRRLDMVTTDLRESVMKARMQPVGHVFAKFPRLVRDLSPSLGRRVRLEMEGQETELDKSLLEAIKDPMTHAVRNAIDHGIEPPEARRHAGKSAEGLLRLRAFQQGSHVVIEIADDGAGIRVERIRAKAIERRLVTPQKAAQMSEHDLLQLIFLPGFSTAASVTHVSGRGVGMDVVRTNVEKIGGKVEMESRAGKGTTLRLRIPLTLAIIPALIVREAGQSFALPQGALVELVHLSGGSGPAIEWIESTPLLRLRGRLLPLVFLGGMLGRGEALRADGSGGGPRDCYVAVLDVEERRYGLVVDGLKDPEEIVVKPLSPALKSIGLFSGATVLGSGELALILDTGAIATRANIGRAAEDEAGVERPDADPGARPQEFLLVEAGGARRAIPLADVVRIERVPLSRIEWIGAGPILRTGGVLLPLEDASGLLGAEAGAEALATVVVCRRGARHVGLAVSAVLDVAGGASLVEAGSEEPACGVTLLRERVTEVVDFDRLCPPEPGAEEMEERPGEELAHPAEVVR